MKGLIFSTFLVRSCQLLGVSGHMTYSEPFVSLVASLFINTLCISRSSNPCWYTHLKHHPAQLQLTPMHLLSIIRLDLLMQNLHPRWPLTTRTQLENPTGAVTLGHQISLVIRDFPLPLQVLSPMVLGLNVTSHHVCSGDRFLQCHRLTQVA